MIAKGDVVVHVVTNDTPLFVNGLYYASDGEVVAADAMANGVGFKVTVTADIEDFTRVTCGTPAKEVRMQSRRMSAVESLANIAIGYGVALVSQMVVFPAVGVQADMGQNVVIGLAFTVVSLVRSYALRRWFNRRQGGAK